MSQFKSFPNFSLFYKLFFSEHELQSAEQTKVARILALVYLCFDVLVFVRDRVRESIDYVCSASTLPLWTVISWKVSMFGWSAEPFSIYVEGPKIWCILLAVPGKVCKKLLRCCSGGYRGLIFCVLFKLSSLTCSSIVKTIAVMLKPATRNQLTDVSSKTIYICVYVYILNNTKFWMKVCSLAVFFARLCSRILLAHIYYIFYSSLPI